MRRVAYSQVVCTRYEGSRETGAGLMRTVKAAKGSRKLVCLGPVESCT